MSLPHHGTEDWRGFYGSCHWSRTKNSNLLKSGPSWLTFSLLRWYKLVQAGTSAKKKVVGMLMQFSINLCSLPSLHLPQDLVPWVHMISLIIYLVFTVFLLYTLTSLFTLMKMAGAPQSRFPLCLPITAVSFCTQVNSKLFIFITIVSYHTK